MEEHEQEERELTSGMERALAAAIGAAAQLLEAHYRRRTALPGVQEDDFVRDAMRAQDQWGVAREARKELAVRRDDGELWLFAPYSVINDEIMREHGIDPRRVGEPDSDKEWITRASGEEVLDIYAAADRWYERSPAADAVRENIVNELTIYGVNLDDVLAAPREAGAEMIETARAEHWAEHGVDPTDNEPERSEAKRDGEQVERLVNQADAADRTADSWRPPVTEKSATAKYPRPNTLPGGVFVQGVLVDTKATRSQQAADARGDTEAGKAAALAARDHPTHPRKATATTASKSPKAATARTQPARERGHGR